MTRGLQAKFHWMMGDASTIRLAAAQIQHGVGTADLLPAKSVLAIVRERGLEPLRPKTPDPKSGAYAISPLPRLMLSVDRAW